MTSERKVEGWVVVDEGNHCSWFANQVLAGLFAKMDGPGKYRVLPATLTIHEEGPE